MNKKHIVIEIVSLLLIIIIVVFLINLKLFVVDSGSMRPTLEIGDLIVVKKNEIYNVGDIVTYYDDNFEGYITHRIIEKTEDGKFIMKGDFNNVEDDKKIDTNEVIGRVIFKSKLLGLLLYKYKIITIITLIVIVVLINLYSIFIGKE